MFVVFGNFDNFKFLMDGVMGVVCLVGVIFIYFGVDCLVL